jgi:hypothetical protein
LLLACTNVISANNKIVITPVFLFYLPQYVVSFVINRISMAVRKGIKNKIDVVPVPDKTAFIHPTFKPIFDRHQQKLLLHQNTLYLERSTNNQLLLTS